MPREVSRPLLISDAELKERVPTLESVSVYAEKLQKHLEMRNVKMMQLDAYSADLLIESDFLKK